MRRLALIFLFACGASQTPAAHEHACAAIAQREADIIGFVGPRTQELQREIADLCAKDAWPDAIERCLQPAKTFDELSACHDRLTPAQRAAYEQVMQGSNEPPPGPSPRSELLDRQ
jgi:hypothetical protein